MSSTHTQPLHIIIIHKCVTHSFLSIHEHPRGNHVNKVQKVCKPVQDNSTTHLLQSLSEKDCITVTCHLAHSATTHPIILLFCHPKHNLRECVTYSFHPPSQTPVVTHLVANFLSGPKGKNACVCTSLNTHA